MKNYIVICLTLGVVMCISAITIAQDFKAGNEAYKEGDYSTALKHFRPLAEQGDVNAQFYLGQMYNYGEGVPRNLSPRR